MISSLPVAVFKRRSGGAVEVSAIRCLAARRQPDIAVYVESEDESEGSQWQYEIVFSQVSTIISAAVEGAVDEAVARKLIAHAGGQTGDVYGKNGKPALRQKINGYNNAARRAPWIVLVDLDDDADCAPPIHDEWIPAPAPNLCFRIAVREVQAWLMADAQTLPEKLARPKDTLANLARRSRRRDVCNKDMAPREKSGRRVGPAYASRLIEYVQEYWQPDVAAERSESLRRAIRCLRRLVTAGTEPG